MKNIFKYEIMKMLSSMKFAWKVRNAHTCKKAIKKPVPVQYRLEYSLAEYKNYSAFLREITTFFIAPSPSLSVVTSGSS